METERGTPAGAGQSCSARHSPAPDPPTMGVDISAAFRAAAAAHAVHTKRLDSDRAEHLCAPQALPPAALRSPVLRSAYDTLQLVRQGRNTPSRSPRQLTWQPCCPRNRWPQ